MFLRTASFLFLLSVTLSVAPALPVFGQATSADIRALLQERDRSIKQLLGKEGDITDAQRDELRLAVNDFIDFREMGMVALGPHWDELSTDQQDTFVQVFGDIVRHQSLANLDVYRSSVTYDEITVDGDRATVLTTTTHKDIPMVVAYELIRKGDAWFAWDIILDEVSTVGGYSRSFQTVIRKRGFDSLMTSLNKRLDSIRTES
ncbi:MAG: ABC transporter substrate-binding protein [Rhodothermales bacterium]